MFDYIYNRGTTIDNPKRTISKIVENELYYIDSYRKKCGKSNSAIKIC